MTARAVIDADARAVAAAGSAVETHAFADLAAALSTAPRVVLTGAGTSASIAARGAHLLALVGCPAFFLAASEGLHGGLGAVQPGDWVVALSRGGGSAEVNDFCALAQGRRARVAALTCTPDSAFATAADLVLTLDLPWDSELGGIVATGSSLAMGALLDALVEAVRIGRGTDWEALLAVHPAGAVGRDAERLKRARHA